MATGRNVSAEIGRLLARTATLDPDLVGIELACRPNTKQNG
jgi:hypothetical protein